MPSPFAVSLFRFVVDVDERPGNMLHVFWGALGITTLAHGKDSRWKSSNETVYNFLGRGVVTL